MSSGGVTGSHDTANTRGPAIVVGRKGSHGSVFWTDSPAFVIDTAFSIDSSNTECHLRWLYWVLISLNLGSVSNDVGVPGLSREAAYESRTVQVTLEQQRRIADFLDDRVARIDRIIAGRMSQMELVRQGQASEIEAVVHSAPSTPRPLQSLTDPLRPIQYGIVLPGPDFPGGVPIIKGGDIGSGRLSRLELNRTDPKIEQAYVRSRVRPGDFAIAIRGSVGEVDEVPSSLELANLTQDSARIAPLGCERQWVRVVLTSPTVQAQMARMITGATVKGINIEDLRRVPIPVPSVPDQLLIARRGGEVRQSGDRQRAALQRSIDLLTEYKQSLITAAVTGELDVTTAGSGIPG